MIKFIVAISCAANASCPLGSMTLHKEMEAKTVTECQEVVRRAIRSYNYEPRQFSFRCLPSK